MHPTGQESNFTIIFTLSHSRPKVQADSRRGAEASLLAIDIAAEFTDNVNEDDDTTTSDSDYRAMP